MTELARVAARLARAGCVAPHEEAIAFLDDEPDDGALEARLVRREAGEPVAWITGWTSFSGARVRVDPGVYVPRPQTEVLARRAAARLRAASCDRVAVAVDACTGSGAIAAHLTAEVPDAVVVGVDVDPQAVRCALANGVAAVVGDLGAALRTRSVDVIVSVPPYVPTGALDLLPADVREHEPALALDGGRDGLDVARRLLRDAVRVLRPGGWLLLEVGGDQDEQLMTDLGTSGFVDASTWTDEEGDVRGLEARLR